MTFATAIHSYRIAQHLTQEALARQLEVTLRTIVRWEQGARPGQLGRHRLKQFGIEADGN